MIQTIDSICRMFISISALYTLGTVTEMKGLMTKELNYFFTIMGVILILWSVYPWVLSLEEKKDANIRNRHGNI